MLARRAKNTLMLLRAEKRTDSIKLLSRFECLSGTSANITEAQCQEAGCCWSPGSVPNCFHTTPSRYNYIVEG